MTTSKAPSAKDLQADLERLEARRAELQTQLEEAHESLAHSRAALVDGDGSAADVTSAQSTYIALKEALAELDTRIIKSQEEHRTALATEHREEQTRVMREAADTGAAHRKAFAEAAEEANRALAPYIARMSAAVDGMVQAREVFVSTGISLESGIRKDIVAYTNTDPRAGELDLERRRSAEALIQQLKGAGADLTIVLSPWAGTRGNVETVFDKASPLPTPEPYGPAILEGMAAKRKADREERQRRENAVRGRENAVRDSARLVERRAAATAEIQVPFDQREDAQRHLGELVKDTVRLNGMMTGGRDQLALTVRHNDLGRAQAILAEKMPGCKYSVKRDMTL